MPSLSDPLVAGKLELKNRIVMPPMANDMASPDGAVTNEHIEHYVSRALGGPGLVIIEHSFVMPSGRMTARQLGIHDDSLIPGLKRLAGAIREAGARSAIQLAHAGANTDESVCGGRPAGPSELPLPGSDQIPRALERDEIPGIIAAYEGAARRAIAAGFDAIEIHGAHGFLLNEFVSPLANNRTDDYGGSTENRMRLPLEVIEAVRRQTGPDYPLLYRFGAGDFIEGGLEIDEAKKIARALATAGIDILDISGGLCGSRPKIFAGVQGFFVPLGQAIKSAVDIPVIAVGGIKDSQYANSVIIDGKADLVAVGRQMLKNPNWARDALKAI